MLRFLALDLALHAYIAFRLLPTLPGGPWAVGALLLLIVATASLLPFAVMGRRSRREQADDRLTFAGYLAAGAFSSLFVLTLARDAALLIASVLPASLVSPASLDALRMASAAGVPMLAAALTLIGLFEARRVPRVKRVDVPIAGLPAALHGFSIVQVSDLHVGPTIKRKQVEGVVARVNALDADMIAVTGDLVTAACASSPSTRARSAACARATAPTSSPATTSTTRGRARGSPRCASSACACC
jgi:hypothetical protein